MTQLLRAYNVENGFNITEWLEGNLDNYSTRMYLMQVGG